MLGGTASQLMKLAGDSDYLFVDEAGQVTLELLAVLGQLARNLILEPWRGDMASVVVVVEETLRYC